MADISVTGQSPSIKEIYINWKQLTAKEVIKKEKEGQTAPPEILKWAEEIAKINNAPDDVTYDIARGVTDIDKLNELLNNTVTANTETENNPEENAENPEQTEEANAAQQFRQGLADSGVGLRSQGRIMTGLSAEAQTQVLAMMGNAVSNAQNASNINAEADTLTDKTISDTEATKQEYDSLMNRAQSENNPLTREERARLTVLGQQLGKIGTEAQQQLQNMSNEINTIDASASQNSAITQNATMYGAETADVGLELMGKNEEQRGNTAQELKTGTDSSAGKTIQDAIGRVNIFKLIFNANYRTGFLAARQGAETMDTASLGEEANASAQSVIEITGNKVNTNKQKIENATTAKAQDNSPAETDTNNQTDEEKAAEEQENLTLADTTITTDANEIIKRKERKGLS